MWNSNSEKLFHWIINRITGKKERSLRTVIIRILATRKQLLAFSYRPHKVRITRFRCPFLWIKKLQNKIYFYYIGVGIVLLSARTCLAYRIFTAHVLLVTTRPESLCVNCPAIRECKELRNQRNGIIKLYFIVFSTLIYFFCRSRFRVHWAITDCWTYLYAF